MPPDRRRKQAPGLGAALVWRLLSQVQCREGTPPWPPDRLVGPPDAARNLVQVLWVHTRMLTRGVAGPSLSDLQGTIWLMAPGERNQRKAVRAKPVLAVASVYG